MIHILIRYLGIKTKLLDIIEDEINRILPNSGTVLDMFSGSTIVGQKLSQKHRVIVNDIQQYSYAVGKATIEINKDFDYSSIDTKKIINSKHFQSNHDYLSDIFCKQLIYEANLIKSLLANTDDHEKLLEFKNYYENTPHVNGDGEMVTNTIFKGTENFFSKTKYNQLHENRNSSYYQLFTLKYTTPYFSLHQAIFIDSFRYAIEKSYAEKEINQTEYYIYISLLIYSLNNIVTSVGDHFAQPQQFKIDSSKTLMREVRKILTKKSITIQSLMIEKETEFKNIDPNKFQNNQSLCNDYRDLFTDSFAPLMNSIDVIYIDPPYTNAHYSRFYHILETLVKYDYPHTEHHGRYRTDRYQSPFGIRSRALTEFDTMVSLCRTARKKLVISYSDTKQCILTRNEVFSICQKYYSNVQLKEFDYLYRNFGQIPNKVKGNELIIICEV